MFTLTPSTCLLNIVDAFSYWPARPRWRAKRWVTAIERYSVGCLLYASSLTIYGYIVVHNACRLNLKWFCRQWSRSMRVLLPDIASFYGSKGVKFSFYLNETVYRSGSVLILSKFKLIKLKSKRTLSKYMYKRKSQE